MPPKLFDYRLEPKQTLHCNLNSSHTSSHTCTPLLLPNPEIPSHCSPRRRTVAVALPDQQHRSRRNDQEHWFIKKSTKTRLIQVTWNSKQRGPPQDLQLGTSDLETRPLAIGQRGFASELLQYLYQKMYFHALILWENHSTKHQKVLCLNHYLTTCSGALSTRCWKLTQLFLSASPCTKHATENQFLAVCKNRCKQSNFVTSKSFITDFIWSSTSLFETTIGWATSSVSDISVSYSLSSSLISTNSFHRLLLAAAQKPNKILISLVYIKVS